MPRKYNPLIPDNLDYYETNAPGGGITNIRVSAGTVVQNLSAFTLSNSNNVSFGLSGSTVTASASYPTQTAFVFSNSNGVSFGTNGSTVTATVATNYQSQGAYLTTAALSNHSHAFATTTTNGALIVVGTTNSNGATIGVPSFLTTAQPVGAYLTTARASNDAIGLNSALTGNGVSVTANSSGLSINVPAFLTTAAQSDHSHGNPTLALTNLSGTTASNSAGFTLSLSANVGGGAGDGYNIVAAGGSTANTTGTIVFSNSNGVSFGLNGATVTATVATNYQSQGAYLTTAAQSNHSHNFATTTTNGSQIVVGTTNSAGATIGVPPFITTATQSTQPVAVSGSNGSFNFSTLSFGNLNGLSFYTSNGSIVGSYTDGGGGGGAGTNTALNLTNLTGTLSVNTNGVSLSMSAAAAGAAAVVTRGSTFIPAQNDYVINRQPTVSSLGQNVICIYGALMTDALTGSILRVPLAVTNSSSAASSGRKALTIRLGIYTTNATNSTVLSLWQSTSYTIAASYSSNASWMLSMATAVGDTTSYNTLNTSSAGLNLSASLHGNRDILMPLTASFSSGSYWFAFHHSTSGSGTVGNVLNIGQMYHTWSTFNRIGVSTNATGSGLLQDFGIGSYSATSSAFPNGISMTQINQSGLAPIFYIGNETV